MLEDVGVMSALDEIMDVDYELRTCVRGSVTKCDTYQELGDYLISLGERLIASGEGMKYASV